MLPTRLIELRIVDAATRVPAWLSSCDEVWLRPFCDEVEAFSGRTVAGMEVRVRGIADALARQHGVAAKRVEGVWTVERRRWRKEIDAPVDPAHIRSVVFDLAARYEREDALAHAATTLGIDAAAVVRLLFADRESERILLPPESAPTPASLVEAYNLALAQALVACAVRIRVTVRSDARHVLSYAKLLGLMFAFVERQDAGIDIELSGPLSLFHETTKYGHAVARFLPALASTPGWAAIAQIRLRGDSHVLRLSSSDPLPRAHALPRSYDSKLEKRLALDLRSVGSERGFRLERESAVVSTGTGGQLFYPDFTLASERGRVLVEVVGFWTPEYLAKKQRALAAVKEPIVVCVHDRHARELDIPRSEGVEVVTYRDRIDVHALLDAAERALGRC